VSGVHRVVVTGLGVVSPIGHTAADYWRSLINGVSGLGPITVRMADELTQKVAAEVKDFDPLQHFDDRQISTLDRISQFAVVAAREAIAHAGITIDEALSLKTAAIVGSGAGGQLTTDDSFYRLYHENKTRVFPLTVPKLMVNASASQISMQCGIRGPAFVVASACASATHAIGLAFQPVTALTLFLMRLLRHHGTGLSVSQRQHIESLWEPFRTVFEIDDANQALIMLFRVGYASPPHARTLRRPAESFWRR